MVAFNDTTLTRPFLQQVTATWPSTDSLIEVRAINVQPRDQTGDASRRLPIYTGLYDDADQLSQALTQFDQQFIASGTHFTINPRKSSPDLTINGPLEYAHGTTSDADIDSLRTVVIDIDPKRPSKCSSTEEERQCALDCALAIAAELGEFGFPEPLRVMSGNGYHLYYGIDLSVDQKSTVQSFLQAVSQRFSSDLIDIDRTVGNPSRIMKLPGTWARKGENTEDRPHRMAIWENTDCQLGDVTQDHLEAVIKKWHKSPTSMNKTATPRSSGGYTLADLQGSALHDLEAIESSCSFMAYCRDHPADLSEPQWFSQMSIIARCADSEAKCLERSQGHPEFDEQQTLRKRLHVLNNGGPHTCQHIEDTYGHEGCAACPLRGLIKSPINSGRSQAPRPDTPPSTEDRDAEADEMPHHRIGEDGIELRTGRGDNITYELIANFSARIIRQIDFVEDESLGRSFELHATLRGRAVTVHVPAADFEKLDWVKEQLGAEAWMIASPSMRREIPSIIQRESLGRIETERVYTSTGWIRHDAQDVFVHASGGLGSNGLLTDLRVELPTQLNKVQLVAPGANAPGQQQALEQLLAGLPQDVAYPLLAAIVAPPLQVHYSMHISGQTGSFKSEVAAIAMSFYGSEFRRQSLPESWSSTANALVKCAHHARDILMVIDDFKPSHSRYGRQQQQDAFDRVIRATANQSDRSRLNRSSQHQQQYHPRGFVLSTGEELPQGQSMRARLWEGRLKPGQIRSEDLTVIQQAAHNGTYCQLMSGFIQWLAADKSAVQKQLQQRIQHHRECFGRQSGHRQAMEVAGSLMAALEIFFQYLTTGGILPAEASQRHLQQASIIFQQGIQSMAMQVQEQDPLEQFREALQEALATGQAQLGYGSQGLRAPKEDPSPRGDDIRLVPVDELPRPATMGCIVGQNIYLYPDTCLQLARKLMPDEQFLPCKAELARRLHETGWLSDTDIDSSRQTYSVRRIIGNQRVTVWCTHLAFLRDDQDRTDQESPSLSKAG